MKINKLIEVPFGITGLSLGVGIIGEKLGSEGLQKAGVSAGKFISPSVNISMGGFLIKQLKGLKSI